MDGNDSTTELQIDPKAPVVHAPQWAKWLFRTAIILLIAIAVVWSAYLGVRFRHWMWETTTPIRFTSDIDRGFDWGRRAATEGYLNQYEKMQLQQPRDADWLDYGPLRLSVMTLWARWALTHYPGVSQWHQDRSYGLTAPVLWFNTFMEAIGIVSAFFLTRLWARRGPSVAWASANNGTSNTLNHLADRRAGVRPFFAGCIPGLAAAGLLWFNPAIVISGYGWPTWDLWIVPMFLLAVLLASLDWWFAAGIVIGVGSMFKGQQLVSVPVFFIWALFLGRPVSALRMLAGVTIAVAAIASPWLVTYLPVEKLAAARAIQAGHQASQVANGVFAIHRAVDVWSIVWVCGVLFAAVAMPFVARMRFKTLTIAAEADTKWRLLLSSQWTYPAIAVIGTFLIVAWPWMLRSNRPHWVVGEVAGLALAAAIRWTCPRSIGYVAAGAVGTALLLCMAAFHGSSAWYDCGIRFGTIHWPMMTVGETDNLPGILLDHFHWSNDLTRTIATLPNRSPLSLCNLTDIQVSEAGMLRGIFYLTLAISAMGIGMHARRRDSRFLVAIVTPWLMFFCFPPQIHERYLLFAAGISCVCAGISTGMTLLGALLSVITALMTLHTMLIAADAPHRKMLGESLARQFPFIFDKHGGDLLLVIANGTHPDLGFAVVLIGLVFLYFTLAPRQLKSRRGNPTCVLEELKPSATV